MIRPLFDESLVLSVNWPHLSLADRCCLAAAERLEVTVYTADGEWVALDSSVRVELIR